MAGKSGVMVGIRAGEIVTIDLREVLAGSPGLNAAILRLAEPLAH